MRRDLRDSITHLTQDLRLVMLRLVLELLRIVMVLSISFSGLDQSRLFVEKSMLDEIDGILNFFLIKLLRTWILSLVLGRLLKLFVTLFIVIVRVWYS